MKRGKAFGLTALGCLAGMSAAGFDRLGLVDSLDYATYFDVETRRGTEQVVDHVLSKGANAILWRANGGGVVRWPSREESGAFQQNPFDKRRLPENRPFYGALRLDRGETNLMAQAFAVARARGVPYGVWLCDEEVHWTIENASAWNLARPEYWCRTKSGVAWPNRASRAFREVFERKLRMVAELLDMEPQMLYVDLSRNGCWTAANEYVRPRIEAWRAKHGCEPPDDAQDERWLQLVAEDWRAYFCGIRRLIAERGNRTRLCVGLHRLSLADDREWKLHALDWKALAREGLLDGIVVGSVVPSEKGPGERLWRSVRDVYAFVRANCGAAKVWFGCNMYDYSPGIPSYAKWSGDSPATCARKLLDLARESGAAGVVLEAVDYGNYTPEVVRELRRADEEEAR